MIEAIGRHETTPYYLQRPEVAPPLRGGSQVTIKRPANAAEHQAFIATIPKRVVPLVEFVLTRAEMHEQFPGVTLNRDPLKPYYWQGKELDKNIKIHVWVKKASLSATRQSDFADGKVVALYPDIEPFKDVKIPSAANWSNTRDFEVWDNHPKFLKMPLRKLIFHRIWRRYVMGAIGAKNKLGEPNPFAMGYAGILSGGLGMAASMFAGVYVLYSCIVPDMTVDTGGESGAQLPSDKTTPMLPTVESAQPGLPQNGSGQMINQSNLISQIGTSSPVSSPTKISLQG